MKQHVSVSQLTGFFLANLCGMVIVLLSVQFYSDVLPAFTAGDSFLKKDYIIVSKRVSTLGSAVGQNTGFTEAEVSDLKTQPFTERVGEFRPAQFKVSAGMGLEGMQLSTAMFFESVPDGFVDVNLDGWHFEPGMQEIPIVIPRNYLNLYNFGFAQSRNMPQISEGMMGMMPLDIRLSGRGQVSRMQGRIVGFSDRLNTILVPESFLEWANSQYGEGVKEEPSRLILEVKNPADDRIAKYFKDKGYETENDKLDAGKTTWFLKVIVGIVLSVGLLISVLLPADAEHLPAAAEEYHEAGEPAADRVQSGQGGGSVSGADRYAERVCLYPGPGGGSPGAQRLPGQADPTVPFAGGRQCMAGLCGGSCAVCHRLVAEYFRHTEKN